MNTEIYKAKLQEELQKVISELQSVGRINPDNAIDWEAKGSEHPETQADDNEVADNIEEYDTNSAILNELEIRFNEIKDALMRIENGTYGMCATCNQTIESERLNANPAASTCVAHMN